MPARGWTAQETNKHQDHVIAHVVDASVLGYFHADEALHLVLDIGFIWTIYIDGEMGLIPQSMAIAELDINQTEKEALATEVRALCEENFEARSLSRVMPAPAGCRIESVDFYVGDDGCRIEIRGEAASLAVETSLAKREMRVEPSEAVQDSHHTPEET